MFKFILAALVSVTVFGAFAQEAASAPAAAASAAKKHRPHAPKLRAGAKPTENPETQPFKKGGN